MVSSGWSPSLYALPLPFCLIFITCIKVPNWGGGAGGRAHPPTFHTLAKNMSLNRGATHFQHELLGHVLSHP